jgi:NADPH-dependent curcumin reductase CurA
MFELVGKRITMRGFIILDHFDRLPAFLDEVGAWVREGKVQFRETIVEGGVDAAPRAFIDLLRGANTGKMVVKL